MVQNGLAALGSLRPVSPTPGSTGFWLSLPLARQGGGHEGAAGTVAMNGLQLQHWCLGACEWLGLAWQFEYLSTPFSSHVGKGDEGSEQLPKVWLHRPLGCAGPRLLLSSEKALVGGGCWVHGGTGVWVLGSSVIPAGGIPAKEESGSRLEKSPDCGRAGVCGCGYRGFFYSEEVTSLGTHRPSSALTPGGQVEGSGSVNRRAMYLNSR